MAEIALTNGGVALIDDADLPLVAGRKWFATTNKNVTYARTGRNIGMHSVILGVRGIHIDHRNGDGLDNRRSNLVAVSVAENLRNRQHKASGASSYLGVRRNGKKWCAKITHDYKTRYLGTFDTELEAFSAYQAARAELGRPAVVVQP